MAKEVPLVPSDEPYYGSAALYVPEDPTLPKLREAAAGCQACHLWRMGTQTVFGRGRKDARIMLVGEQPGDKEDLAGEPFVGPAGALLTAALEEAGIDPADVYTTNAVKHFKWEPKGPRRLHKKPNTREIASCHPWLEAEIAVVRPELIVCLGATAAQAVISKDFKVTHHRGQFVESPLAPYVIATVHPASILRAPDDDARREARAAFVEDLKKVALQLASPARLL